MNKQKRARRSGRAHTRRADLYHPVTIASTTTRYAPDRFRRQPSLTNLLTTRGAIIHHVTVWRHVTARVRRIYADYGEVRGCGAGTDSRSALYQWDWTTACNKSNLIQSAKKRARLCNILPTKNASVVADWRGGHGADNLPRSNENYEILSHCEETMLGFMGMLLIVTSVLTRGTVLFGPCWPWRMGSLLRVGPTSLASDEASPTRAGLLFYRSPSPT